MFETNSQGTCNTEVLIQWKNLPSFEATWEDFTTITNQFLDFPLEDKAKLLAAGNVRPPIHITYTRRKTRGQVVNDKMGRGMRGMLE